LAERVGGKIVFGGGVLVTAVLTLLTPVAARCSVYLLIALRALEGMSEGVTFPAMFVLFACWIPPAERSRAVTFTCSGVQVGSVVGMQISGVLCDYGFAGGWPSVFYVLGTVGCVWSFAWFLLCYSSPSVHPRISVAEREYIEQFLEHCPTSAKLPTPWIKILTSLPVWACAIAQFANNWGGYTLLTCLPMYLHDVLQFDMTRNGILSALTHIATWLFTPTGGYLADWLRAPNRLQATTVVKLFNTAGLLIPGLFLISVGFLGCNRVLIVFVIIISAGTAGLSVSGYSVSLIDIAPRYAGTLMGLTNTFASVSGILAPHVVGALTYHESTRTQWQKVFYIAFAIYCIGTAVFAVFGSGEIQDWAMVPQTAVESKQVEQDAAESQNTEQSIGETVARQTPK